MAFLTTSRLMVTELESSVGVVVPTIQTTDTSLRMRELDFTTDVQLDDESSRYMTADYAGLDESISGVVTGTYSATVKIAPAQYDASATGNDKHRCELSTLFQNAGLVEVGVNTLSGSAIAGTWGYYPSMTNSQKTMSVCCVQTDPSINKSQLITGKGAMSNLSISVDKVGNPFQAKFNGNFAVVTTTEVPTSAAPTFDDTKVLRTVPDNFLNTSVTFTNIETNDVVNFCVNSATFETGNDIQASECQAETNGILNYFVSKLEPVLTIDPLLKSLTDWDWYQSIKSSNEFYTIVIASDNFEIHIPRAQVLTSSIKDSNGQLRNELKIRTLRNTIGYKPTALSTVTIDNIEQALYFLLIHETVPQY